MDSEMDPAVAEKLYDEGGFLIFLDVPPNTEFGIDMYSWNTGDKFKGLKMIPPGLHFVYYSATSKEGQTAPRTGFFHCFKKREILIKKWDPAVEDIFEGDATLDEVEAIATGLKDLDRHLGPYPYKTWKDWVSLTNYISEEVLEALDPLNHKINSASQLVPDESGECSSKMSKSLDQMDSRLPRMRLKPGTEIRFTKLPKKCYPEGSTATEITKHNMDSSYCLLQVTKRYAEPDGILGELQMAFVCFVVGQVYDSFEHWKQLVELLCRCDDALEPLQATFVKFISAFHFQLLQVPKDFFVDIVSNDNFLTTTLQVFFSNLENSDSAPRHLVEKALRFRAHLTRKFKWDFDVEPSEYAPVVVE